MNSEEESVRRYQEKVRRMLRGDIVDEMIQISVGRHYTGEHLEENVEPLTIRYYNVLKNELNRRDRKDSMSQIGPARIGG